MTPTYPVYVGRSDGKATIRDKKSGKMVENKPDNSQLSSKDKNSGYGYQLLHIEHEKSRDWRQKLGSMLMREMEERGKLSEGQKAQCQQRKLEHLTFAELITLQTRSQTITTS